MDLLRKDNKFICGLNRILNRQNFQYPAVFCFVYYMHLRLKRLITSKLKLHSLSDEVFRLMTLNYCRNTRNFIDANSCAFGNICHIKDATNWCYLCSFSSPNKFKIFIINSEKFSEGTIYVSDMMKFNLQNALGTADTELCSYFIREYSLSDVI